MKRINRLQIVPTKKKQILSLRRGGRGTKGEERSKPPKNYTEIANFLVNIKNGK